MQPAEDKWLTDKCTEK